MVQVAVTRAGRLKQHIVEFKEVPTKKTTSRVENCKGLFNVLNLNTAKTHLFRPPAVRRSRQLERAEANIVTRLLHIF